MKYDIHTLKNGLRIVLAPMPSTGTATVIVMSGTGSRYEDERENGLAHFLEHMFFKGTKKRPNARAISEELDGIGSHYNAFTGKDCTAYYAKVSSRYLDVALDCLCDIFLNSTLPGKEIAKERGAIIQEIDMYEDMPMHTVGDVFDALIFASPDKKAKHPLGRTILGPKENIRRFSRKDFDKYLKRNYTPLNTVVCVAGSFSESKVLAKIKKEFGGLKHGNLPAPRPGVYFVYAILCENNAIYIGQTDNFERRWLEHKNGKDSQYTRKFKPVSLVHYEECSSREEAVKREKFLKTGFGRKWLKREWKAGRTRQAGPPDYITFSPTQNEPRVAIKEKKTDQTQLMLGVPAYPYLHKDEYVLALLTTILGGSMSSRLFMEVRERRGLAYSVHAATEKFPDTGYFVVQAGVEHAKLEKALSTILAEFRKIKRTKVSAEEFKKARQYLKGTMTLSLETSNAIAKNAAASLLSVGRIRQLDEIFKGLDAVTPADIQRVARDILKTNSLNLAIIGPHADKENLLKLLRV